MPFDTVVLKTIEYLKIPSVVGHEEFFLDYLKQDFEKLGLTITQHDGLLEISGSKPYSNIISAHADRHGLISLGNDRYAYAAQIIKQQKYDTSSKYTENTLQAIQERFIGEDVLAYCPKTGHIIDNGTIMGTETDEDTGQSYFTIDDMAIENPDIPIAYSRNAETRGDLLRGQIDNVVSLGIIYVLFQNGFLGTALLTCEEEIGKSWTYMKEWFENKDIKTKNLFVLDTSPYREKTPIQENMVVLRNRDKSGIFHADMIQEIKRRCTKLNLNYQMKDEYFLAQGLEIKDLGSTELGRLVLETSGEWNGATLQIPTTEYHTSYETTSRGCIESFYRLLSDLLIENPLRTNRTT